ncbi:MAG: threonylcarbamoyl-AMP synthase [Lachnospiraceae bacterium]
MKTIVEKIDKTQLNSRECIRTIEKAGGILKAGGLVAFPTETVYGLGADGLNEEAAEKIYAAKGRPSDNPLIIHITDMPSLKKIVKRIPGAAVRIAEKYWPGPLTMIFEKADIVPYGTTGGLKTVAVRMPCDETAAAVIRAGGGFIAAPSANISGRPSPTEARHVKEDLDGRIDMIVDGGPVDIGVESTILDMTVTPPMILRPGAVTREMLEELVGTVCVDQAVIGPGSKEHPKAPGMKYRHYAPRAELLIVEGEAGSVVSLINQMTAQKMSDGYKVGIIGTDETAEKYERGVVKSIGTRTDEAAIASRLYGMLRDFDDEKVDYIFSEAFSTGGIGTAVMNRLLKAAGHHVIHA